MIEYRRLFLEELKDDLLVDFNRHQSTEKIFYVTKDGSLSIKDEHYVEFWNESKKIDVVNILRYIISDTGGAVFGAFVDGKLKGFAGIKGSLFGSNNQYLNLSYIHVSSDVRGSGIGKKLFSHSCDFARESGASKLYIGANPSYNTYMFYKSLGCVLAREINQEVLKSEPLDLQLEFNITK